MKNKATQAAEVRMDSTQSSTAQQTLRQVGISKAIGGTVRKIRNDKGVTLQQLADATGLDTGNLSRFERAQQGSSIDAAERIARALGLKLSEIISHTEAMVERESRKKDNGAHSPRTEREREIKMQRLSGLERRLERYLKKLEAIKAEFTLLSGTN